MHVNRVDFSVFADGLPKVENRKIEQNIIVGLRRLEARLTAFDVAVELRQRLPKMTLLIEIGLRIFSKNSNY